MLTKRQRECLTFIESYQTRHKGWPPTMDELAVGLSLKSKGAGTDQLLRQLEDRGYIRRHRHSNRSIEVLKSAGGKQPPFKGAIPIYDARTHEIRGWLA
jgi:repressor LexA